MTNQPMNGCVFFYTPQKTIARIDMAFAMFDPRRILDHCDTHRHRWPYVIARMTDEHGEEHVWTLGWPD